MGQISTWDASQLALSFGTIQVDSGFGEGSMVTVEVDQKDYEVHKGADGSVTFYKVLSKVARATITLSQSSIINDLFSAQRILDKATPGGAGLSAFQLKDLNGTSLITAAHARIEGAPQAEFAMEVKERAWVIILADADIFLGGNPPQ